LFESFYGLNRKPFQITTDPSFLWMGKKHREAFSTLKYGVMDNKGFLLLTGDVGTGKTTLINRLVEDIQDRAYTAKIPDPRLSKYDFYRMVARYFRLPIEIRTKSDFLVPFSRFLNDTYEERKSVLLLIDEAQRLKHDLMDEIRLLSNLERQDAKLLNIFFVGQNEFNSILLQPENRALMRRLTITYNLDPLDRSETGEYIRHRLKVAGAAYEIFSTAAMDEVYDFSAGFPRQINIICDLAMFFAAQLNQRIINRKIVSQCRERISFPVDDPPARAEEKAPAPTRRYRPVQHTRRPGFDARRALGIAAVLLVLMAGIYLIPHRWIARAGQWVRETYQTYLQPAAKPTDLEPPAVNASKVADINIETFIIDAASGLSRKVMPPSPALTVPRRPPDFGRPNPADERAGNRAHPG
jgi:general secretion pathway protein A